MATTTMNFNWTTIAAVLSALAGVAGSVITPIWGSNLATSVQAVLQAISGILVVIAGWHVTAVTASTAKAKAHLKLGLVETKYTYTPPLPPAHEAAA